MEATDYYGRPLAVGDLVEAWHDSSPYRARVEAIAPHQRGDGDFRRLTLSRVIDGARMESYSDAVTLVAGDGTMEPGFTGGMTL